MSYTEERSSEMDEVNQDSDEVMKAGNRKKRKSASNSPLKYRQKFCLKWLELFHPWLDRCHDNPNKPFCRACQCRLDCNKCHLQRHERTSKHAKNLEILLKEGEGAAKENLSIRQERSKYYHQRKMNNMGYAEIGEHVDIDSSAIYLDETMADDGTVQYVGSGGGDHNYMDIEVFKEEFVTEPGKQPEQRITYIKPQKTIAAVVDNHGNLSGSSPIAHATKRDRVKLFMQIKKEKNELLESFKELMGTPNASSASLSVPTPEKNTVDLFFESVSSTVKTLSPKLIAEAKMRVSQLICELELRSLTESEVVPTVSTKSPSVLMKESVDNAYILNTDDSDVVQIATTIS